MDIAKYVGLYLLKNNFCYIHGLGNLELKKKPASHDGQALQGPQYEVTLSMTGSIDDSLANFIATHEQTSISKAANSLRDFSDHTKAALQEGKEVVIPSLGKFVGQGGVARFITDPHLQYTPPSIPILRTAKRLEDAPSFSHNPADHDYNRVGGSNGTKIGIGIAAVILIGILIFAAMKFMGNKEDGEQTPTTAQTAPAITPPVVPETVVQDTSVRDTLAASPATAPVVQSATGGQIKVILGTYPTRAAAEKRARTLTGNGNTVETIAKDSTVFYVAMPITFAPADSARTLDSLRRMFNPKGVSIYR